MANKVAMYRNKEVLRLIESWFTVTSYHDNKQGPELYQDYLRFMVDMKEFHASLICCYEDFARAMYSLGIVNIAKGPEMFVYRQMPTWRPSLNLVRRLNV